MLRSFWFYFYSIPVLFSLISFSVPHQFFENFINSPLHADAVEYCKDALNEDTYATEYGTMQDKCIANFMGEPQIMSPLIFLFSLIGLLFIIPLIVYLILSWFNHKK